MRWGRAEQPGPSAGPAGWMDLEMALGRRQGGVLGGGQMDLSPPALAGQGSYPLRPLGCPCSLPTPPVPPPRGQVAPPTLQPAPPHMGSLPGVAGGNRRHAVGGSSVGGGVGVWGALSREGATGWRESVLCPVGRAGRASPPGPLPGPSKPEQQHVVSGPLVCPGRKGWEAMEVPSPSSSISDLSVPGPVRLWAPPMQGPARPCPFCPEGRHALPCLSPSGAGPGEGRLGGRLVPSK